MLQALSFLDTQFDDRWCCSVGRRGPRDGFSLEGATSAGLHEFVSHRWSSPFKKVLVGPKLPFRYYLSGLKEKFV